MRGSLSPSLKAVGRGEYLQMWIDGRSNIADASEKALNADTGEEGGIAEQLYTACVDVLKELLKVIAISRSSDSFSQAPSSLPTPTVSRLCSNNKSATITVEKLDESLKCGSRVASANLVKYTHGCIGTAPRTYNIRADGDDEISDTILAHSDLLEPSQRNRTSGTIARLKSLGQRSVKDALGKLFLWGEGLMDGGLDRALGESDELRDHVLDSLCGIAKILRRRLLPLIAAQPPNGALQRRLQDLNSLMDQSTLIISHDSTQTSKPCDDSEEVYFSESDVIYDGGNSDEEISDVEMHHRRVLDIGNELKFRTQCLMDLLPSLEQNIALAESDHPKSSVSAVTPFSISTPAYTYISLLRDKYRNADEGLIERLGEANWQRHVFVRRKMEQIADGPKHELTTLLEEKATIFHDSGIGTTISGPYQYAASATSHTSFISSRSEAEKGFVRVPPTPKEITAGESFCCNFCGLLQSELRNRVDWKMHVFADIRPYICTFTSCIDQLTAFPTRQLWAEHEFRKHRMSVYWECPECEGEYTSPKTLEIHLDESHGCILSGSKRSMLVSLAHRTRQNPVKDQKCPLCMDAPGTTRKAYVSHLARHMEEIALLALPRETEADSEAGSEADSKGEPKDQVASGPQQGTQSDGEAFPGQPEASQQRQQLPLPLITIPTMLQHMAKLNPEQKKQFILQFQHAQRRQLRSTSPAVSAPAPPTSSAAAKANLKAKKNDGKTRKRPPKKTSGAGVPAAAAPANEPENAPSSPNPATPVTPMNPNSFSKQSDGPNAAGPISAATSAPIAQPQPDPNVAPFMMDEANNEYNIGNFGTDMSGDVLENFDFDCFLQSTNDGGAFNFDAAILNFAGTDAAEAGAGDA